jgi:hypothetical protein
MTSQIWRGWKRPAWALVLPLAAGMTMLGHEAFAQFRQGPQWATPSSTVGKTVGPARPPTIPSISQVLPANRRITSGSRGCFAGALPVTAVVLAPPPQGSRVVLGQNFPNPFNPQTEMEFTLPHAAKVKLRIFDVRGSLVATLVDGVRPAGPNHAQWAGVSDNGRSVASGVYLYRLDADGTQITRRMMITR